MEEKKLWFKVNPPEADTRPQILWFRAKRFGWGWTPSTWQGWAVLAMYIFAVFANVNLIDKNIQSETDSFLSFFPTIYILTVFLIIICYVTGEKPKWNWGFADKKGEMLDVLDKDGNKTGKSETRELVHKKGLWHRTVHVFMINSKHEVLLQLRSKEQLSFPSKWHLSAGGHIEAGQEPIEAAKREMEEEIGVSFPTSEFKYIGTSKVVHEFKQSNFIDNEYCDIFVIQKDVDIKNLKLQEKEVQEVRWIPIGDFQKFINEGDPDFVKAVSTPLLFAYFEKEINGSPENK